MRGAFTRLVGIACLQLASAAAIGQTCGQWTQAGGIAGFSLDNSQSQPVRSMYAWDPDGAGPRAPVLIVNGAFSVAGSRWCGGLAVWDGQRWGLLTDLGVAATTTVINGAVVHGAVGNVTAFSGQLYGTAPQGRMVLWNGAAWDPIGIFRNAAGTPVSLSSLVPGETMLLARGPFSAVDGVSAAGLAAWDGAQWRTFDQVPGWTIVTAIEGPQGEVFIGGYGADGLHAAGYHEGAWHTMDAGPFESGTAVFSLAVHNGQLWACGNFSVRTSLAPPAPSTSSVAVWNGAAWESPPAPLAGIVSALQAAGGELYAMGLLGWVDRSWRPSLARLEGTTWRAVGGGLPGSTVQALSFYNGSLIAGGLIYDAGNVPVQGVAAFGDGAWRALDGGGIGHMVTALGGWRGHVIAAGADFVSRWDGSRWSPMDDVRGRVTGLAEFNGELVIAGNLQDREPEGWVPHQVLRWNGQVWRGLPSDPPSAHSGLGPLVVHRGSLVVFGRSSGGSITLDRWNGTVWEGDMGPLSGVAFGGGGNPVVTQTAESNGDLVVAGTFAAAEGIGGASTPHGVARWDGQRWTAMDAGLPEGSGLNGLATWRGDLFGKDQFTLWHWDGAQWRAVLRDTAWNAPENGTLVESGDELYCISDVVGVVRFDGDRWVRVGGASFAAGFMADVAADINGELWCGSTKGDAVVDGTPLGYVSRWSHTPALPRAVERPTFLRVRKGATAQLRVGALGSGPLWATWRHEGGTIENGTGTTLGGTVTGNGAGLTLQIRGVSYGASGLYQATVSNACGSVEFGPLTMTVTCGADFSGDGRVSVDDAIQFLNAWFLGDLSADVDGVSPVGYGDLIVFVGDYVAGCP